MPNIIINNRKTKQLNSPFIFIKNEEKVKDNNIGKPNTGLVKLEGRMLGYFFSSNIYINIFPKSHRLFISLMKEMSRRVERLYVVLEFL